MDMEPLNDRYQLHEPIGRGGMATIYRAWDLHTGSWVALKALNEQHSTNPKFVTRFQFSSKRQASVQHPNIVQVYDFGQDKGTYFIVMELVEGTDLRRYLRARGVLEVETASKIAHEVALGLGAIHQRGIVHRSVMPQNILISRSGEIKLTGFSMASMDTGMNSYASPEQLQGEIVSPAADIYALGIVLYGMLVGHVPFDGDTPVAVAMAQIQDPPPPPRQFNPAIAPGLEALILRCLEKQPDKRFQHGDELARALERSL